MKWFKIFIAAALVFVLLFLAFVKPNRINLEGNWEAKKIILDGKKVYPDTLAKYISFAPEIIINNWSKSLSIPIYRRNFHIRFEYLEAKNNQYKIKLSSDKKLLNGVFDVKVDTIDITPNSYVVVVELKSKQTIINFQKQVIIPPWKPEFPKRGLP